MASLGAFNFSISKRDNDFFEGNSASQLYMLTNDGANRNGQGIFLKTITVLRADNGTYTVSAYFPKTFSKEMIIQALFVQQSLPQGALWDESGRDYRIKVCDTRLGCEILKKTVGFLSEDALPVVQATLREMATQDDGEKASSSTIR